MDEQTYIFQRQRSIRLRSVEIAAFVACNLQNPRQKRVPVLKRMKTGIRGQIHLLQNVLRIGQSREFEFYKPLYRAFVAFQQAFKFRFFHGSSLASFAYHR